MLWSRPKAKEIAEAFIKIAESFNPEEGVTVESRHMTGRTEQDIDAQKDYYEVMIRIPVHAPLTISCPSHRPQR